jgi:hypothetical protein
MRTAHHRLTVALGVLVGSLVLSAAPALAAPPETPETGKASAVTATTATLEGGVLNPKAKGELGEYEYRFRVSESECEGERSTAGVALGEEKEAVPSVSLTELQPNAHYTFCLIEHNLAGEYSLPSTPEHFTTKAAPPAFESESFSSLTQTTATLEAQINPNNQATTCKFEYGTSATLSGAATAPCEPPTLEGFPSQHASANLAALSPNTVYFYRVAAENGAGRGEGIPIQELRTAPPPPTVTVKVAKITASSATIEGTVDPGSIGPNSETLYSFIYRAGQEITPTGAFGCQIQPGCVSTEQQPAGGPEGGEAPVPVSLDLTKLAPLTIYHYRLLAGNNGNAPPNQAHTEDETFTTRALAPGVMTDPPVNLDAVSATLAGRVVPQGAPTTYQFEYGTTMVYGSSAPAPEGDAGSSTEGQHVTVSIAGLRPDMTYHYRLVATNSGGKAEAEDRTFTTNAAGEPGGGPLPPGFSLTGTAPTGPAAAIFPNLAGFGPVAPPAAKPAITAKALTNVQKLAKAIKACQRKPKRQRAGCVKQARAKYGAKAKKKK